MALLNGFKVELEQCLAVEWLAKPFESTSDSFTFQNVACTLQLYHGRHDGFDIEYRLYIGTEASLRVPFNATVYLVDGIVSVPCARKSVTEKDNFYLVWNDLKSEISNRISSFEESGVLHFRVVLQDGIGLSQVSVRDKAVQTPLHFNSTPCLECFSQDFSKLLDGEKNTPHDVVLKCGDQHLQAHKVVLSTRSDVFDAMLSSDMVEGRTGEVNVKDMEETIFKDFIRYLYTGVVPKLTVDNAIKFYEASDQYDVKSLMLKCSSFLMDNVSPENACDYLALAEAHTDEEFKENIIKYILDQKIPVGNAYWQSFCAKYPVVANEIYSRFVTLSM